MAHSRFADGDKMYQTVGPRTFYITIIVHKTDETNNYCFVPLSLPQPWALLILLIFKELKTWESFLTDPSLKLQCNCLATIPNLRCIAGVVSQKLYACCHIHFIFIENSQRGFAPWSLSGMALTVLLIFRIKHIFFYIAIPNPEKIYTQLIKGCNEDVHIQNKV